MYIKCRTLTKFFAVVTALLFCVITKNTTTNMAIRYLSASTWFNPTNVVFFVQTGKQLKSSSLHFKSTTLLRNFRHALSLRADADRFVILAMTDEGYIDIAINFYKTSLRAHHIDNFLFVGVGEKSCEILMNTSIPCFYYADDPSAHKFTQHGGGAFNRKMRIRTHFMIDALEANYTVIHCDTDVIFLRNPLPHLKVNVLVASTLLEFG